MRQGCATTGAASARTGSRWSASCCWSLTVVMALLRHGRRARRAVQDHRRAASPAERSTIGSAPITSAATCWRACSTARARRFMVGLCLGRDVGSSSASSSAPSPAITAGWIDDVLMRITEIFQVMPRFFLALFVVAIFGANLWGIIFVIGILNWSEIARLLRAEFLTLKERPFVTAARAYGRRQSADHRASEILPNASSPVIVAGIAADRERRAAGGRAELSRRRRSEHHELGHDAQFGAAIPAAGVVERRPFPGSRSA